MEKPVPMDRLICGDVGFGKTEIALRAAFKAVQDGKQVAVLVPTTLLVQQHYETFSERFEGFPVNVAAMSRFQTTKEINEAIEGLETGTVDVVIGTHKLLNPKIKFKDLGLVIIDEEQRFGVEHKETLKALRTNVDVLSLSATPIPRTLEMAVTGIREMSTLATPPEDRLPVLTYVAPTRMRRSPQPYAANCCEAARCSMSTIVCRTSRPSPTRFTRWCPRRTSASPRQDGGEAARPDHPRLLASRHRRARVYHNHRDRS